MNRISTFMDANAGDEPSVDMDSERLLSRHLEANNISVSEKMLTNDVRTSFAEDMIEKKYFR